MLEKVTMQRTEQFADFALLSKDPVIKYSACLVSLKIAIECRIAFKEICLFLANHSLEFKKNLAREYFRK